MTHFENGKAVMVDVSDKAATAREAVARSHVLLPEEVYQALERGPAKGDPVAVAELAGIMAAKRTSELIPLCHPLSLTKVTVRGETDAAAEARKFYGDLPRQRPNRRRDGGADRSERGRADALRHA